MPYQNVPGNFGVLSLAPWYRVTDLMDAIKQIRKVNFSIVEQRQQAFERLAKLADDCPFTINEQFPAQGLYVCEMIGDWDRKFQQLKLALSYKDHSKDDKFREGKDQFPGGINDAQVAFWNSTTAIMTQLINMDNVFSRLSFELKYSLTWN
jgi:hypothetical protein